jgi:hypothetical protein
MSGSFHINYNFVGPVFYANICKHSFPYCGPTQPPGAMILTNINLWYVWKLQNKLQLSWSCGYLEKKIKYISYIKLVKNSFPYCGPTQPTGAKILTNLIF